MSTSCKKGERLRNWNQMHWVGSYWESSGKLQEILPFTIYLIRSSSQFSLNFLEQGKQATLFFIMNVITSKMEEKVNYLNDIEGFTEREHGLNCFFSK